MININSATIIKSGEEYVGTYSMEEVSDNCDISDDKIIKVLSLLKKENILNDNITLHILNFSIVNDEQYITNIQILENDILSNKIVDNDISKKIYLLIK